MYNHLFFRGPETALPMLISEIESRLPEGWSRRREIEDDLKDIGYVFCFRRPPVGATPAVDIVMQLNSEGALWVSNLLAKGLGKWPERQFNAVLQDFYEKSLPGAMALGISVELRDKPVPIQDFLSERAWRRLRSFSGGANRHALHPSDTEQWSAFLALAHLDRTKLASDRLYDWLTLEQRWPKAAAHDLMNRYEDGMELLAVYDQALAALCPNSM